LEDVHAEDLIFMEKGHEISDLLIQQQKIWDNEYRTKGRLWGKVPFEPTAGSNKGIFLDLGCGDGKNLRRGETGTMRIGLDFSMHALRLCRKNPDLCDVTCLCADVRHLPIKNNAIQSIDAHHILGHLLSPDRYLCSNEINRILSPGGEVLITVFGSEDLRYGHGNEVEPGTFMKGTGIITHYFSSDEINKIFLDMDQVSLEPCSWIMKVKGNEYVRSTWVVTYKKENTY